MIDWMVVNTDKINRVGYNKAKSLLYIDFKGSDTDTVFLDVPEALYNTFTEVKAPDQFYTQFVVGYFDIVDLMPNKIPEIR